MKTRRVEKKQLFRGCSPYRDLNAYRGPDSPGSVARIRRQLAFRRGFDVGKHVGGATAGKEAGNDFRRNGKSSAGKLLRCDVGHDRFAVYEDAVAIENEHTRPLDRPNRIVIACDARDRIWTGAIA